MAVVTWDGSASTSAATDANWDTGTAPDATSDVVIPDTSAINRPEIVADVTWNSLTIQANAEFAGNTSYTLTLDGEADGTGATTNGYAVHMAGNGAIGTDINLAITTAGTTLLHLVAASGTVRNFTYNASGRTAQWVGNTTISGDLAVTAGTLQPSSAANTLTVTGDVSIASGGTLNDGSGSGAYSFGSLTIASGGTYSATSGTTTITGEASSYALKNDGTFTHNNGLVVFDFAAHTLVKNNTFYDLELNMDASSWELAFSDTSGNAVDILGDLTITQGTYDTLTTSDTHTIHGNTHIAANGLFFATPDHDTNKIIHHGLVTNLGTYKINDGTTVKMNGGIRQLGTLTIA